MKKNLPTIGILIFATLYFKASKMYPGGNQIDRTEAGFNWFQNYWCDLLGTKADNGLHNPARPVAMLATAILCASLAVFWVRMARRMSVSAAWRQLIEVSAVVSMTSVLILFTDFHDTAIIVSGTSGLLAVGATFVFVFQKKMWRQWHFGWFCMVLVLANNLIYWSKSGLFWLPVLQKITFCCFLFWVAWIDRFLGGLEHG